MEQHTLLLVDDNRLLTQGLCCMLEPEYRVVGVVSDSGGTLASVARVLPDAVLLGLALPNRGGMGVLADLATVYPSLPVVVVSMHHDPILADLALELGAWALVPRDSGIEELRAAISRTLAGTRARSPLQAERHAQPTRRLLAGFHRLTPREQEILRRVAHSETSKTIAAALGVSPWTVHFHRKNILRKLALHGEREMIRYAMLVHFALRDGTISETSGVTVTAS